MYIAKTFGLWCVCWGGGDLRAITVWKSPDFWLSDVSWYMYLYVLIWNLRSCLQFLTIYKFYKEVVNIKSKTGINGCVFVVTKAEKPEETANLFTMTAKLSSISEFCNHVTNTEDICSIPSLSSALGSVCDHQQVPAMKSLRSLPTALYSLLSWTTWQYCIPTIISCYLTLDPIKKRKVKEVGSGSRDIRRSQHGEAPAEPVSDCDHYM